MTRAGCSCDSVAQHWRAIVILLSDSSLSSGANNFAYHRDRLAHTQTHTHTHIHAHTHTYAKSSSAQSCPSDKCLDVVKLCRWGMTPTLRPTRHLFLSSQEPGARPVQAHRSEQGHPMDTRHLAEGSGTTCQPFSATCLAAPGSDRSERR
jgi:hypothetical protein